MIKVIGVKRIMGLAILLGINATLAAGTYLYLMPQNQSLTRELNSTRSNIVSKTKEARRLGEEYDLIQRQRNSFESLQAAGFMGGQDRILARERMEAIQAYSDVLVAEYSFSPVQVEESEFLRDSNQVLLRSDIQVNVNVVDDMDFYKFIYWLENGFPGHIAVNDIDITKEADVNDVTLRQIGNNVPVVMGRGTVNVTWRTMVPRDESGVGMAER